MKKNSSGTISSVILKVVKVEHETGSYYHQSLSQVKVRCILYFKIIFETAEFFTVRFGFLYYFSHTLASPAIIYIDLYIFEVTTCLEVASVCGISKQRFLHINRESIKYRVAAGLPFLHSPKFDIGWRFDGDKLMFCGVAARANRVTTPTGTHEWTVK